MFLSDFDFRCYAPTGRAGWPFSPSPLNCFSSRDCSGNFVGAKKTVRAKGREVNSVFLVQLRKRDWRIFTDRDALGKFERTWLGRLHHAGLGIRGTGAKNDIEERRLDCSQGLHRKYRKLGGWLEEKNLYH